MRRAHLFFYFFYFVCCFVTAVNKPLKFHVAGDQDNDNVMIRAVWWGYLNPSNIVALENPKRTDDEGMEMILGEDMTSEEANDKKKKRQERFGVQNDDDDDDNDAGLSAEEIELRNKRRERFAEDVDEDDDNGMEMESTTKRREVPHDVKVGVCYFLFFFCGRGGFCCCCCFIFYLSYSFVLFFSWLLVGCLIHLYLFFVSVDAMSFIFTVATT